MTKDEEQATSDFKSSLKTTGLFGGVQVFKILLSIISNKFIAILLGPTGMGIAGMFGQTTGLISNVSGLGLGTSAVRDLSSSYSTGDKNHYFHTLSVFRRLVWATGMLGLLICLLGAPFWSKICFGDGRYTWAFALLSLTILLGQVSGGQGVIMQTTRNFKIMAKSGIIGSVLGTVTSIPLYFAFGINGIVPAIMLSSVLSIALTTYFAHKIPQKDIKVTLREVLNDGHTMLTLGFFIMLQGFMNLLCAYLIRIYISRTGSLADVGMYSAGFSVINAYVGTVFSSMGTEYYPRLSTYANDTDKFNQAVNQQMEISLLLTAPLIAMFLTFGDLVVVIFYSKEFLPIAWMINWAILAIFFRAPSWCLGFTFMAKGDTKAFWINEFFGDFTMLVCNVIGYTTLGLTGLGVSFLVSYIIYLTQNMVVTHFRYKFALNLSLLRAFVPQLALSVAIILVLAFLGNIPRYILGCLATCASAYISYRMLNKYIDVKAYVRARLHR